MKFNLTHSEWLNKEGGRRGGWQKTSNDDKNQKVCSLLVGVLTGTTTPL